MAADGVVDFRDADLLDRRWSLRLSWLTKAYSGSKRAEVALARHMRYTGALGTDDAKLFEKAWKLSGKTLEDLDAALRPWLNQQKDAAGLGSENESLIEKYKRVIGDMSDPVFRSKMEKIANDLTSKLNRSGTKQGGFDGWSAGSINKGAK
jgi:hypothetical protein